MKLFSNSYLNDYNILNKAVIGFEFEFYSKLNYPLTLETFNRKLGGIKVLGFKQYHSDFKPDTENFKLEPDLSGGFSMAELVTGPMPYTQARLVLVQCLKIIQEIGYTTDRSSVHINISFPKESGKNIEQLNILKLILNLEETKVYQHFPNRKNNIYAKSIKNIIPFRDYDYSNSTVNVLSNSLLLPKTKYYGVNFTVMSDGRLEYRYVGGEDYQFKVNDILELLDYFVLLTWECLGTNLEKEETDQLRRYLDDNIRSYKSLSKFENFMAQYPTVDLQIDTRTEFEVIKSYYPKLYSELYDLVTYSKGLENCIINYDTELKQLEVVDADINTQGLIKDVFYINCRLTNGDYVDCLFKGCHIDSAIINMSKIKDTIIDSSKLMECGVVDSSYLTDCYFSEGYIDCEMKGGVFRSGKIGPNASISDDTKILNDDQNFFNISLKAKVDSNDKKGKSYSKKDKK